MKKTFLNSTGFLLLILLTFFFAGCRKENPALVQKQEVSPAVKVASDEIEKKIQYLSKVADTIVFDGTVNDFKINDIIISKKDFGVLRKVSKVLQTKGSTTLVTSPVSIAESFPNMNFSSDFKISPSSIDNIDYTARGISLNSNTSEDGLNFDLKDIVVWDKDGNPLTTGDQVTADGKLLIQLNPYLKWENSDGQAKNITFGCNPIGMLEISVDCPLKVDWIEPEPKLIMTIKTKPQTIVIAGVPIIITNEVPIYFGIKGSAKAKLTGGIRNTTSLHAEICYDDGGFSFSKSFNNYFEAILPSVTAETNLQAFIMPELNMKLYGVVGPSIDLKGFVREESKVIIGTTGKLSSAIYGGIEVSLGLILKVFDFRLASYEGPPIISYEKKISEWTTDQNKHPLQPTFIEPVDNALGVSLSPLLSWNCTDPDNNPLLFNVYFGTSNPPLAKIGSNRSEKSLLRQNLSDNTIYFWRVTAIDDLGDSTQGPVWRFTTKSIVNPPNKPYNPSPATGSKDQPVSLTLSWDCSDPDGDNLTYDVYFGTSATGTTLISSNQTALSINRTGLLNNKTYYWKVIAKDGISNPVSGDIWNFTTKSNSSPNKPSDPTPVPGAINQAVSLTLSWSCTDPDGDNLTYDVYFGTSSTETTMISSNQTSQSITRTGLLNNKTYYWKVIAKDGISNPSTGDIWSFTTKSNVPPAKPFEPNPYSGATSQPVSLTLSWNCTDPDNDNLTYDVYLGTSSTGTTLISSNQTARSITRNGLLSNKTYYWKVVAKDGISEPTNGDIWNFKTADMPPAKPSNPSPASGATNQPVSLTLSWNCTDPDGDNLTYDVYFGTSIAGITLISSDQTSKNITRTGLMNNKTYYWKIVAKDGINSPVSGDVWNFTTIANQQPEIPWSPVPGDGSTAQPRNITLSWNSKDPEGDGLAYEYFFGTESNPTAGYSTGSNYFTPPTLGYSTKYYWRVQVTDGNHQAISSPVWSFTSGPLGNTAPAIPGNPSPANESTGKSTSLIISWNSSDSEGDMIFNTVLLGKTNPPQTIVFQGSYNASSFSQTGLDPNTKYYWQVKSMDSKYGTTIGPIWYFTTGSK